MLEYEWGNPSTIILAGNEGGAATEPGETHRQILDHNCTFLLPDHFLISQPLQGPTTPATATTCFSHHHHFNNPLPQPHQHHHPFFDPRAFPGASPNSLSPLPSSVLFPDPIPPVNARLGPGTGLRLQDVCPAVEFVGPGLGLNLGGRTYFATSNNDDDDSVNRLYRRYKTVESHSAASSNSPRCQAQGCNVDLSDAKHYHRRHKVCEFHSKAATVIAAGLTQRFCQQCSRFHLLAEFDNGKRSCRRRLADHNRRRRKLQQPISQEIHKSHPTLDNITRSSPDSGTQSSSSVMVTESPPDYFRQRPHQIRGSSTTSGSFCFSNG